MADEAVTVYQGSGTLAQAVLSSAPEGMLIAPVWKRVAAFVLDVLLVTLVIELLTMGRFLETIVQYGWLFEGVRYGSFFLLNYVVFGSAFYLYFKYTGQTIGRSLGQRGFRIAIVHDNGTLLEGHHWGPRSLAKLVYLIPVVGILWFGLRDVIRGQSKEAEYRTRIDTKNHTVAAVDWSLPSETRLRLR